MRDPNVANQGYLYWRQIALILCAGFGFGRFVAELAAFVARTSPGETPIGSAIIAAIFGKPCSGMLLLLARVA